MARTISPVFSTKSIRAKEHVLHSYIDLFVEKMREFGGTKDGIELNKVKLSTLSQLPRDDHRLFGEACHTC